MLVPLVIWMAGRYGAATGPLVQNLLYVTVGAQLMHRSGLPREKWRWYGNDLLAPLAAAGVAALCLRLAMPDDSPYAAPIAAWLAAALAASLAAREVRAFLSSGLTRLSAAASRG